ncbi:hypothetical protein EZV62_017495 [Acer yangbiense]|uniref:Cytochrome P450 n=1 Tax=Acer yangbiense TaxID=1000413 RepID=A0A5C7HIH6_9ROSI|nr:hypothetical protein EZV62_017495 [Acer yangbiense]
MLFKVGRIPFVIINSAEAAREVLKVHDIDSCSRAQLTGTRKLSYNFLDIAFAPYGDYWKQMRKICVLELFSLKRAQSFRFIREEEKAIEDHRQPERAIDQDQEDIIDVMLKLEKDQTKSGEAQITKDNIKANIFLGVVDTSSITVIWAMSELARNPRLMKKAQDEVRNCIGKKGRVTEDDLDLDQLPYLKMIIKETLRLHPPAPLLVARETISHFKIDGYDVNPIQVNVWAIGRDPKYWKNAEEFYPERFTDNSIDYKGQNFEFLPFGSGKNKHMVNGLLH